jgi:cell division protein YceG involved in septum cleavage
MVENNEIKRERELFKSATRRAMSIILPLCMLSFLICGLICSAANDIYAFVKKDMEITLQVEAPSSLETVSKLLGENGVVNNSAFFNLYVRSKRKVEKVQNFTGEITLNSSMSYREILEAFS